jgi:hypothetical protein
VRIMAEGVDNATWLHHLGAGDYSRWLKRQHQRRRLADEVAIVEKDATLSASESRQHIKEAIDRRYTAGA